MTGKQTLRRTLRARRVTASRAAITPPAPFRARLAPHLVVATYAPLAEEADPASFANAALAAGCRLALPHVVDRATPLRFLAWDVTAPLATGPYGLANPHPHWAEATPDIILTPLVGFDARGNRIGQGAGHYDRAFAAFPDAWRVGIAYSVQQVPAIDADPWDLPLHAIATEHDWIVP